MNVHVLAVYTDLALVERVDADDGLDQRRLARAVVADQRHHLALAHREVDAEEGLHRAERLRDASALEKRGAVAMVSVPQREGRGGVARRPSRLVAVLLTPVGLGGVSGADLLDRPEAVGDDGVHDVVDGHGVGVSARYRTTPSPSGDRRLAVLGRDPDRLELEVGLMAVGSSSAQSARACLGRDIGLGLDRLVDADQLLAQDEVLHAGLGRVLAAHGSALDPGGLEGVDRLVARPSFAAKTASTLLLASVRICSMIVCASALSQAGTNWSATISHSPASAFASAPSAYPGGRGTRCCPPRRR